jgi:hypothetical protein
MFAPAGSHVALRWQWLRLWICHRQVWPVVAPRPLPLALKLASVRDLIEGEDFDAIECEVASLE